MIPPFNISGVLPPFVGENSTNKAAMSPYKGDFSDLAISLGTTPQRVALLQGLAAYRTALRKAGFAEGFQWIDGSFVEDVETLKKRPPNDIDVVTFAALPSSPTEQAEIFEKHGMLFDPGETKRIFQCDAYFVDLAKPPALLVKDTCYWFGLFGHQRVTSLWKGMIEVPLSSDDELLQFVVEVPNA
ncbi:DUF6932 family protein [Terrihabitans sp. B22-R8]|uniref:DUF6932 family protein n=1 Tax=Terrihabitans sp. B22-R8 TaxID=3425128 RepID=UPI00403C16A2